MNSTVGFSTRIGAKALEKIKTLTTSLEGMSSDHHQIFIEVNLHYVKMTKSQKHLSHEAIEEKEIQNNNDLNMT